MEINGTSDFGVLMLLLSSWKHIESFKFSKNTQGSVLTETMSNAYTHIANGCKLLHARLRQQSFIDLTRVSNVVIQCEFSPLFVGSTVEHREPLTTHDPDLLREGDRTVEGRAAPYGQITTLQLHSARCRFELIWSFKFKMCFFFFFFFFFFFLSLKNHWFYSLIIVSLLCLFFCFLFL